MAKWATITDDFPGAALGALWDGSFGTFTVSGNKARFDSASYSGADSVSHDLSSSSVLVKVEALATGYAGLLMRVNGTGNFACELNYSGTGSGTLTGRYYGSSFGGSDQTTSTNLGAGARTIWFRFRHDGTTLFIEYSADGSSWTTLRSDTVSSANVNALEAYIDVGPDPGSSSGSQLYSKLNLPPTSAVALDGSAAGTSSATGELLKGELSGSSGGLSATGSTEDKAVALVTSGRVNRQHTATPTDYTIAGWCKPNASGPTQAFLCVNPNSGGSRSGVFYGGNLTKFRLEINGSFTNGSGNQATGSWHHVALVVTGTVIDLWVNGVLEVSGTVGGSTKLTNTDWVSVGAWRFTAGGIDSNFLNATVDEVTFFARALAVHEIQFLADKTRHEPFYSAGVTALAPYFWWRLGDSSGTTAADSSGNTRTGTYTGTGVTYSQTGVIPFTSPPELSVTRGLDGSAAGSGGTSGDLAVAFALAGTSDGTSTADGSINVPVPLDGSSGGTSTASGDASLSVGLTGTAGGSAATAADLALEVALAGTSGGTAATSAALDAGPTLTGTSAGAGTATASLTVHIADPVLVAWSQPFLAYSALSYRGWEVLADAVRTRYETVATRAVEATQFRAYEGKEVTYGDRGALLNS